MKRIIIEVEDLAYEPVVGMLKLCNGVRIASVQESMDVMDDRDACMRYAINTLRHNKVFRYSFDYAWIMMAMGQKVIDDFEAFHSHQDYIDYLTELGIEQVPSRSTIFNICNITLNDYPEWEFLDAPAPSEALRRKNLIKQFLSAYRKAKRES